MNCNYVKNKKYVNYKDLPHWLEKLYFRASERDEEEIIINRFLIEHEIFSLIDRSMGILPSRRCNLKSDLTHIDRVYIMCRLLIYCRVIDYWL